MTDIQSDQHILDATTRKGDEWTYAPLGFTALNKAGGSPLNHATAWCNAVRSEYERQESERAEESRRRGALARGAQRAVEPASGPGGGESGSTEDVQDSQGQVPKSFKEVMYEQVAALAERKTYLQNQWEYHSNLVDKLEWDISALHDEIKIAEQAVEVLNELNTRQASNEMGDDLCGQVQEAGEGRSGEVGQTDDTEGGVSPNGEGC